MVVTSRAPGPGTARCSEATSCASGSTCVAADLTNAARSVSPLRGAYSHTCRPSGSATWVPGMITEPSPEKCTSSQCSLRLNRVGGMFA
ncbi:hypothetical protein PICSAR240_03189 [Mycobacterium avium subsp. paratuberculosis]|nr:hypothetical protein PICSAR120_02993 [Mycobacterium avium subsp. paratuberculosis]CAG6913694.1 hypothetical protein PICSAR113_03344 [Mycobacterium avium subsp. paratuberculosis]CAG6914020.1 hypothetical protein PICSAR111_03356 [Mycobacterium avium subsp. paratuberculosis]CAG6919043.1 hypothetical protein PICSAR124B_03661 [Mycobacterium avium subsp. paratuberculosis]CAG6919564.1 hypothetical protein PICSAR10_03540 [Mycobacterium avium subsp. paratuberculosis]